MEGLIDAPLAEILKRDRQGLNNRFAYARRLNRHLDAQVFKEHLVDCVAPLVESVSLVEPDRVSVVTHALFDLSLDLVGRRYLGQGSRFPVIDRLWCELLPRIPSFVA